MLYWSNFRSDSICCLPAYFPYAKIQSISFIFVYPSKEYNLLLHLLLQLPFRTPRVLSQLHLARKRGQHETFGLIIDKIWDATGVSVLVIAMGGYSWGFLGEVERRKRVDNGSFLSSSQTMKVDRGKGRGPCHLPNKSPLARPISPAGQVKQASS